MVKRITVEKVEDTSLWDSFVSSSPQGTVFSTSLWLNAASKAQGGEPRIMGVWENEKLVAGVSFIHIARGPFKKATSPVLTPYGGFIYRPDPGKRASEAEGVNISYAEYLTNYLHTHYNNVFLVHSPGLHDIRPFTWAGWTDNVRYTYIVDITDTEKIWDMLERRVRTVIRNAESSLEISGPVDVELFTGLYEHIYHDRRLPLPVGSKVFKAMVDNILRTDIAEMQTVRDGGGNVISSMITVSDSSCVYAWVSGSIPEKNASGAFSLLFWDAVKRHSSVHKRLDMVGANIRPIAFFKKGFGGILTPYYVTEHYSSQISRTAMKAFSWIRRFKR